mgnify:CR=1 FL=1
MKNIEVIEKLKEWHQPYEEREKTRDLFLCGDPEEECTGIAVTCCATLDVMQKAAEKGINLIISHEGISYNYEKVLKVSEYKNEVLLKKLAFAKEHHITVWRDHDHMHGSGGPHVIDRIREDMIFYGTMKELGWEEYVIGDRKKPLWYKVPKQPVRKLAQELMEKWHLNGLRVVGNLDAEVETVYICEHVNATQFDQFDVPKLNAAERADVLIPLEIVDYTLTSYVRDAAALGLNKVILEMGHFNAEELGMRYLEKVLPEVFDHQLKVEYIQSGDTFQYISAA